MMKLKPNELRDLTVLSDIFHGVSNMITLSPDEAALIKAILTALRGIKVRDIDKALVILAKTINSVGER
jgi:large exoprotein involved in heme utilization and adhesion